MKGMGMDRQGHLPRAARAAIVALGLLAGCVGAPEGGDGDEGDVADTYASFEEFEASTAREVGTGFYIVEGDIPIYTREELFEFYQENVAEGQLIVHTSSGVDASWSATDKLNLTYCVSTKFGANYDAVAKAMNDAAAAWSNAANVRFTHLTEQDGACTNTNARVTFDVEPTSGQAFAARAFFPNASRDKRTLLIDASSFGNIGVLTLTGILRHELGHAIGFRHEHTRPEAASCFEDSNYRDLSSYDSLSVMHYKQCNGTQTGDLVLTDRDKLGAAALYGRRNGGAENLAYGKAATQSSNYEIAVASRAVDGNIDGDYNHRSVSHTNGEASPWWQVDLGAVQPVGEVILHNRTDGSAFRLANFQVHVSKDGATWRTITYPGPAGPRHVVSVNEAARYVKVQLVADGTTRFLHMGEVEVLAARNLAKGKPATQSSVTAGGAPARAVDGNTNGNYSGNSVSHTDQEASPWWQVDLQAVQPIGDIVIYNRTDCCAERLSSFKVLVSSDGTNWTSFPHPGVAPTRKAFAVNIPGRYVKVQLDNLMGVTRYLSLAEVEVIAPRNLAKGKTASQSSNFDAQIGIALRAIDGATNGDFAGGSTTSTATSGDNAPWWQVDLGSVQPVGDVVLFNRTDCCSERLTKFKLLSSLDGQTWTAASDVQYVVGRWVELPVNRPARFVRVLFDDLGTPRVLSLAEVEVLAGRNLALAGAATQSSTFVTGDGIAGDAFRAIDGSTDGDFNHKSVTHTNQDAQAYWQVDLGALSPINEIALYNRTDGSMERLSNFKVRISEDGTTWKDFAFPGQAGPKESFKTLRVGRYVRVQLEGTNFLSLAEAEAYLWQ